MYYQITKLHYLKKQLHYVKPHIHQSKTTLPNETITSNYVETTLSKLKPYKVTSKHHLVIHYHFMLRQNIIRYKLNHISLYISYSRLLRVYYYKKTREISGTSISISNLFCKSDVFVVYLLRLFVWYATSIPSETFHFSHLMTLFTYIFVVGSMIFADLMINTI